ILSNRKREALITYNLYLKEQKKKYKQNPLNPDNWQYCEETDTYICPNQKRLEFQYHSVRTDRTGFQRRFKIYECEDCSGCPFRS
ncbi:transposase, partial [Heyndrickxia oleronia]